MARAAVSTMRSCVASLAAALVTDILFRMMSIIRHLHAACKCPAEQPSGDKAGRVQRCRVDGPARGRRSASLWLPPNATVGRPLSARSAACSCSRLESKAEIGGSRDQRSQFPGRGSIAPLLILGDQDVAPIRDLNRFAWHRSQTITSSTIAVARVVRAEISLAPDQAQ